jgi:hypothetical protein
MSFKNDFKFPISGFFSRRGNYVLGMVFIKVHHAAVFMLKKEVYKQE